MVTKYYCDICGKEITDKGNDMLHQIVIRTYGTLSGKTLFELPHVCYEHASKAVKCITDLKETGEQ